MKIGRLNNDNNRRKENAEGDYGTIKSTSCRDFVTLPVKFAQINRYT